MIRFSYSETNEYFFNKISSPIQEVTWEIPRIYTTTEQFKCPESYDITEFKHSCAFSFETVFVMLFAFY